MDIYPIRADYSCLPHIAKRNCVRAFFSNFSTVTGAHHNMWVANQQARHGRTVKALNRGRKFESVYFILVSATEPVSLYRKIRAECGVAIIKGSAFTTQRGTTCPGNFGTAEGRTRGFVQRSAAAHEGAQAKEKRSAKAERCRERTCYINFSRRPASRLPGSCEAWATWSCTACVSSCPGRYTVRRQRRQARLRGSRKESAFSCPDTC